MPLNLKHCKNQQTPINITIECEIGQTAVAFHINFAHTTRKRGSIHKERCHVHEEERRYLEVTIQASIATFTKTNW